MSAWAALACLAAAVAAALLPKARRQDRGGATSPRPPGSGWLRRGRPLWAGLAAIGPLLVVSGPAAVGLGAAAALLVWWAAGREDPARARATREAARDLPGLVLLVAAALRSGAAPAQALGTAAEALPGAGADRLRPHLTRLAVGVDEATVWIGLGADPALGPLGRALARSHRTGAGVAEIVGRLAHELAERRRAEATDRARRVGVTAALPLGLCLLPAFLVLGIVPMAAGLLVGLLG